MMTVVDDLKRFLAAVNANSGTDLIHNPPAGLQAIDRCESRLGCELPSVLRQVYMFTDGGPTLFVDGWSQIDALPAMHAKHLQYVAEERQLFGREPKPQGQWVCFLGISPADVVVECGRNGEGGSVWHYFADEMGDPWMKAAPTLDAYVAAHADLAEAGFVVVEPNWGRSGFTIMYLPAPVGLAYDSPAGLAILERHQVTLP